jgi:hypothetical protein
VPHGGDVAGVGSHGPVGALGAEQRPALSAQLGRVQAATTHAQELLALECTERHHTDQNICAVSIQIA